ncbi:hypothetical protein ACHAXR_002767 [Thalassiosira sp. AJA248-18]
MSSSAAIDFFASKNVNVRASSTARAAEAEDLITVRLVSINDVYDLTRLPRLASFVRSLGPKKSSENSNANDASTTIDFDDTIPPSAVTLSGDFLYPSALSSIDNGRGHVAALRAAGITHVSLGNHEADLPLDVIKDRLGQLSQRGRIVVLNSNVSGLGRHSREIGIIGSNCGKIKVGLLGLLSSESGMFRDGTFRGLNIGDVREKYLQMMEKVDMMGNNMDCLVPLTHQSLNADAELAKWMLDIQSRFEKKLPTGEVIIGGHEHVKIHEFIESDEHDRTVQIIKSGQDAERAAIIDLQFNASTRILEHVAVHFEELDERHQPCPIVSSIVNKHLSALDQLQDFIVFDKNTMLSDYFIDPSTGEDLPLSSKLPRYEQTTVGAMFCTAIKSELGADVCIINGAPIKASKLYADGTMSYDGLRNELPFPLKMVMVEMTYKQLRDAIQYSRSNVEKGKTSNMLEDGRIERRGYLQTDFDYWRQSCGEDRNHDFNDDQILSVALPRNLLKGFCKIQPLMDLQNELEARNALPNKDDYIKAVDLIVRYCCKDRWATIAQNFSFTAFPIVREELHTAIKLMLGEEPSDALVDSMVDALHENADGFIDENEFNKLLSKVRSQP